MVKQLGQYGCWEAPPTGVDCRWYCNRNPRCRSREVGIARDA